MSRRHWLMLVVLYLALFSGGWLAGQGLFEFSKIDIQPQNEAKVHAMVMTATGTFIMASAVPFVPGAEIGFGLIAIFGAQIAFLVYVSMVMALMLSYLVGRFVPATVVASAFAGLGLVKAGDLTKRLAPLGAQARLDLLLTRAPRRLICMALRHRYLALVLLFNLPGNSILGGGGGIAFTAGLSGLYPLPAYLAAVLVAVAPVPLFIVTVHHMA